jgi:hypothetical protein
MRSRSLSLQFACYSARSPFSVFAFVVVVVVLPYSRPPVLPYSRPPVLPSSGPPVLPSSVIPARPELGLTRIWT